MSARQSHNFGRVDEKGDAFEFVVEPPDAEGAPGQHLARHGEGFFLCSFRADGSLTEVTARLRAAGIDMAGESRRGLDRWRVQDLDPELSFVIEAEWGPDGALCLNAANTRLDDVQVGCELPACGASFESGGLIQSGKIVAP